MQQFAADQGTDISSNSEPEVEQDNERSCLSGKTNALDMESEQYKKKKKLPETKGECSKIKELLSKTVEDLLKPRNNWTKLSEINEQFTETGQQLTKSKKQLTEAKEELEGMQKKYSKLHSQNVKLSTKVFTESLLLAENKTVKYYIGLPSYELLKTAFEFVTIGLPSRFFSSSCNAFEQFLIVLIELCLNLGDLAYRFWVHQSTVSRYFNVLYQKLCVFVR